MGHTVKPRKQHMKKRGVIVVWLVLLIVAGVPISWGVMEGKRHLKKERESLALRQQEEVARAMHVYFDRYGKYPGDDNGAAARWPATEGGASAAINGNGDNIITGDMETVFQCDSGETEACNVWDHLRRAAIITGLPGTCDNPTHMYGGRMGVLYYSIGKNPHKKDHWVVFSKMPGSVSENMDIKNDDGEWEKGHIRTDGPYREGGIVNLFFRL